MSKGYVFYVFFSIILIYYEHVLCENETNTVIVERLFQQLSDRQTEEFKETLSFYPHLVNSTNQDGFSLLQTATYYIYREAVEILLSYEADVNFQRVSTGDTALHNSTDSQITQMLVNDPAIDLEIENRLGLTPLQALLKYSRTTYENVHILLEAGADANRPRSLSLLTPLHILFNQYTENPVTKDPVIQQRIYKVQLRIAEDLVAHGADVNARTKDGLTPLHFAAKIDNHLAVRFLISKGSDINAVDNSFNRTPSAYALAYDALDALQVLSELNANWYIPDTYGYSVISALGAKSLYIPIYRRILDQHLGGNEALKWNPSYNPRYAEDTTALVLQHTYCREATMRRNQRRRNRSQTKYQQEVH